MFAAFYHTCAVLLMYGRLPAALALQDPSQRLGATAGADEIKQHPWFAGINWALIRNQTPPFIPKQSALSPRAGSGAGDLPWYL